MSELFVTLSEKGIEFEREVRLSEISSFRIGGIAAYAIYPKSAEELIFTVRLAREKGIRHKVIGNTTNILFSDKGFDGALIFTKRIRDISITPKGDNADVICGAGVPLPLLAAKMRDCCLSGAEFASGIPATVGGAVVMNAGAHGGQMSDILVESIAYDTERGETVRLTAEENRLSYRHSIYLEKRELICLGATFSFCGGDKSAISELMDKNNNARKSSQPLELPSAGSFFKRPKDHFAAKLIDDCGLKGYRVGGACISEKHAGFIVNLGGATVEDVLAVAEYARKTVFEKTGIELSREVEFVE